MSSTRAPLQPERPGVGQAPSPVRRPPRSTRPERTGPLFALVLSVLMVSLLGGWGWHTFVYLPWLLDRFSTLTQAHSQASAHTIAVMNTRAASLSLLNTTNGHAIPTAVATALPSPSLSPTATAVLASGDTGLRLSIPALTLSAPVESIGVMSDGSLAMPRLRQWDGAGLYTQGTWPGGVGSAVIDGYSSRSDGHSAIFARLSTLHQGDVLTLQRVDSTPLTFRVLSVDTYLPMQAPLATIFGATDNSYLNLVAASATNPSTTTLVVVHSVLDETQTNH